MKAYFYGHTHRWQVGRESKIHLVNVPATAWLFEPGEPRGLLTASFAPTAQRSSSTASITATPSTATRWS